MSVINTNITSMIGQSNLSKSQSSLATSMERLSSGLRINSAKDDAAGQAIANRMSSQITGLGQAQRNANDGISVAQTAEGGLNQINDNLQRIRELSVQASNDTNSQQDLGSIQDEIDQRLNEIDRISRETDFNGTKVLGADTRNLSIQVGADDGQTISVGLETINRETLGLTGFSVANGIDADNVAENAPTDLSGIEGLNDGATLSGDDADNVRAYTGTGDNDPAFVIAVEDGDETSYFTANIGADGAVTRGAALREGGPATDGPMAALDSALNKVDSMRSELGAVQNRFESAIENLNTNETNLSAARSRIEDADYATEVANMTRSQILQQAGTSVLAQANQIPQNVLSLLG
ncbi:FliC/FljB family flagellin [Vreelandella sp. EE27]